MTDSPSWSWSWEDRLGSKVTVSVVAGPGEPLSLHVVERGNFSGDVELDADSAASLARFLADWAGL